MASLLSAELQVSFHITKHEDHFDCEANFFCEINLVYVDKDIANLGRKDQNQGGCAQAGCILTNQIQNIIVKMKPIGQVGKCKKGHYCKEVCMLIYCLIGEEEAKGRDEEYGCIYFRRILFHVVRQQYNATFYIAINSQTTKPITFTRQLFIFISSILLDFTHLIITYSHTIVIMAALQQQKQLLLPALSSLKCQLSLYRLVCVKLKIYIRMIFKRVNTLNKTLNAVNYFQSICSLTVSRQIQFIIVQQFVWIGFNLLQKQPIFAHKILYIYGDKKWNRLKVPSSSCKGYDGVLELKTGLLRREDHYLFKCKMTINIIFNIYTQVDNMENQLKVKHMASYTPTKLKENIYRVRARFGKKTTDLPHIQIRQTLFEPNLATSLSPRKMKPSLFKNARKIQSRQTYLINEKTYKLSKTNESSSPHFSKDKDKTLLTPLNRFKNNRSMSNEGKQQTKKGKVIQRTVSIVIDGKNQNFNNQKDLMNTLSRIILGEQKSDKQFMIEFLDQSSIYGDQQKFITKDSNFLHEIMHNDNVIEI